jgi:hypothetical protein
MANHRAEQRLGEAIGQAPLDFVLSESEYRLENVTIDHRPFDPLDIVPPTRFFQIFFGQNLGYVNDLAHTRNGGTLDRQVWRQLAGIVDVLQMDANGVIQSGMSCTLLRFRFGRGLPTRRGGFFFAALCLAHRALFAALT